MLVGMYLPLHSVFMPSYATLIREVVSNTFLERK